MEHANVIPLHPSSRVALVMVGEVMVVAVRGDVDSESLGELTQKLELAVQRSTAVLADLCACTSLDSTGLAVLLRVTREAKGAGVRLAVACTPGGEARALFDMVLGHSFFVTCDDRTSGLAALRRPG